jgi:2-polyprenyl-3-methyl-5-hydroxy-6-metoxy-1,4-benzoquinol methylase
MTDCCRGLQSQFDARQAARDLERFQRHGATRSTRQLVESIEREGPLRGTLLDIGGGIGAVQHLLLSAGIDRTIDVDVSEPYVESARKEGERRGTAERMTFHVGDFVDLAPQIESVDVVTLDRVICCYPDVEPLVREAAAHANRLLGLVYPRSGRTARLVARAANVLMAVKRSQFRAYVHDTRAVDSLIRSLGFARTYTSRTVVWQVFVYRRTTIG